MNLDNAHAIAEAIEDEGYDAEVREEYSGRGMFGRTVPAIVTDAPLTMIGWAAGTLDISWDEVPTRTDSMGRQTVVY